jgi:hypothetical protein
VRAPAVWFLLVTSAVVAVLSGALGLAPFVVEPAGSADPFDGGSTWFRGAGLPSECYAAVDVWGVTAKVGLALAATAALSGAVAWAVTRRRAAIAH